MGELHGAMALPEETRELWESVSSGLLVEGYGLTETTAPATVNLPTALRIGSVGKPLPGV